MSIKPWPHQRESLEAYRRSPIVFDMSDAGCVSGDTEYLTPTGWKRIDQYTIGDKVAQFLPDEKSIEFVYPVDYVKKPCSTFLRIQPVRGMSQMLSLEHRVLYYTNENSWDVCSAQEYYDEVKRLGPNHCTNRRFVTTFSVKDTKGVNASDEELRLMVAVIADSYISSNTCTIRLKKKRKIVRIRELLSKAGISYREKTCGGAPDFQVFRFTPPWKEKSFSAKWWNATQHQLEIIAEELPYWDGSIDSRPSKGCRFSSCVKESTEFAQYAFAAAKKPCSIKTNIRPDKPIEYIAQARNQDKLIGPGRSSAVSLVKKPKAFKYCFTTPSSFLLLRHRGYIFATGNTGKTIAALIAFAERRRQGGGKAIVYAPKSLLEPAWENDARKAVPDMRVSVAYAENRLEAFQRDADIYVTNNDAVKWVRKNPRFLKGVDTGIIDESSNFKHRDSDRSKAAAWVFKRFKYRAMLSATPTSKSITEIWHQVKLLDDGQRLGTAFSSFRDAVQIPHMRDPRYPKAVEWRDRPGAESSVSEIIADISIRHKFEDVMPDVPGNRSFYMHYTPSPKLLALYRRMQDQAAAMLNETTDEAVVAANAAVLRGKLLQIASGHVYANGKSYNLDPGRTELIAELIGHRKHSVTFYSWGHQRLSLIEELDKRGISWAEFHSTTPNKDRMTIMNDYQSGRYQTVLMHPATGAHGLTLTQGDTTIWCSPHDRPDLLYQGKKRVHRGGQIKETFNLMVSARHTIEPGIYQNLHNELDEADQLLKLIERGQD